ncbi:GNAT family N-acetyltransferase [Candidatus Margulisiibacteriota bacterium]
MKKENRRKTPILEGQYIRLREVSPDDTEFILKWRNDEKLGRYLTFSNEKLLRKRHELFLKDYFDRGEDYYFICEKVDNSEKIGTFSIYNIDQHAQKAEIGRCFMTPKNSVYGFEMMMMLLKFAFEHLKLNKIYGIQLESNPVLECYLACGANKEGVLKDHHWNGQKLDNIVLTAIFKHEFEPVMDRVQMTLK